MGFWYAGRDLWLVQRNKLETALKSGHLPRPEEIGNFSFHWIFKTNLWEKGAEEVLQRFNEADKSIPLTPLGAAVMSGLIRQYGTECGDSHASVEAGNLHQLFLFILFRFLLGNPSSGATAFSGGYQGLKGATAFHFGHLPMATLADKNWDQDQLPWKSIMRLEGLEPEMDVDSWTLGFTTGIEAALAHVNKTKSPMTDWDLLFLPHFIFISNEPTDENELRLRANIPSEELSENFPPRY